MTHPTGSTSQDPSRRLDEVLAALPRERASDDFTQGVLARLDTPRRPSRRAPILALAASLLLAVGLLGVHGWQERREARAAAERVVALELEARSIQAELDELRDQARRAYPVVYLGGSDDVDVVLDLARLAGGRPASELVREQNDAIRLAAYDPPPRPGRAF